MSLIFNIEMEPEELEPHDIDKSGAFHYVEVHVQILVNGDKAQWITARSWLPVSKPMSDLTNMLKKRLTKYFKKALKDASQ